MAKSFLMKASHESHFRRLANPLYDDTPWCCGTNKSLPPPLPAIGFTHPCESSESGKRLHPQRASFETRPAGALLRMRSSLCGIKKKPHAEEAAQAAVSKHAGRRSRIAGPARDAGHETLRNPRKPGLFALDRTREQPPPGLAMYPLPRRTSRCVHPLALPGKLGVGESGSARHATVFAACRRQDAHPARRARHPLPRGERGRSVRAATLVREGFGTAGECLIP